jgi:hypothetical protein
MMPPATAPLGFVPHSGFDPCDGDDPRVLLLTDNPLRRTPRTRTLDACLRSAHADLNRGAIHQPEGQP